MMSVIQKYLGLLTFVLFNVSYSGAQGTDTGYFWILNDLHYDPTYWTTHSSCNENMTELGTYGDFMCDPPWELVNSAVKALVNHGREPDFIVWLGDSPPHFVDMSKMTEQLVLDIITNITTLLEDTFPGVTVLPVFGNHDYYPKDQLPGGSSDFYDKIADLWDPFFNDDTIKEKFRNGGFYMKQVSTTPVVWAIVMNTNLYNMRNDASKDIEDPGGQFDWLEEQLASVASRNEKVHLFIHISPGMLELDKDVHFFTEEHNDRFHKLLQRHGEVILGVHGGHSHMDTFKMIYNDDGEEAASIFIAPSVTPWRARLEGRYGLPHNPAVRKVTFRSGNHSLIDYEQYYLDLERANEMEDDNWVRLYSYRLLYKVDDLSPHSTQAVLEKFRQYGSPEFHEYYELNTVFVKEGIPPCGCSCKSLHVCAIKYIDIDNYGECVSDPSYVCDAASSHFGINPIVIFFASFVLYCIT